LKYPEYEVITPQTSLSFTVRSLNVQEEETMKGSLLTPIKIIEHLNKSLFESIVKKPDEITDYKSFLKSISLKDRDALLYGLYHITYEEIRDYNIKCSSCSKKYPITVNASDTFSFNGYVGKDKILEKIVIEDLISDIKVFIKQPTIYDEEMAIKNLSGGYPIETIMETLIIDKFVQNESGSDSKIYTERDDIILAYKYLPAKEKRKILNKYEEEFGQYGIKLSMKTFCPNCGEKEEVDIDLVENFFRMVYGS